jgi:hypothetical protein
MNNNQPVQQERLTALVDSIQRLNSTEYEELFKLLHQNKCDYTRNNNGVFLNLSWLTNDIIDKLEIFVKFCHASRKEIQHYEQLCDNLSIMVTNAKHEHALQDAEAFHAKKQKKSSHLDTTTTITDDVDVEVEGTDETEKNTEDVCIKKVFIPRASSTMKFYLLKKKYAKMTSFDSTLQNDLEKEAFIL